MLKKLSGYILALAGLTIIFTSCKKEYESIQETDSAKITNFIAKNNLTGMMPDSAKTGYYYQIVNPGTVGSLLKNSDTVLYTGSFKGMESGTTYFATASYYNLNTFVGYANSISYNSLTYNVPAIRDVMLKMRRGGTARVLLPSYLAFGRNGAGDIPSNENIDLTITTFPDTSQAQLDDRLISEFVASKGLTGMTKDPSGVWYSIITPGTGDVAITANSSITATYTLRFTDGLVLQTLTEAAPFDFSLPPGEAALRAWIRIIPGKIRKGGKIRLIIPSRLGYGKTGTTGIPGNTILDFDVEVATITN
jgi:FKBP-type peptidyl-prolyl cis-trans isomerase FkpA